MGLPAAVPGASVVFPADQALSGCLAELPAESVAETLINLLGALAPASHAQVALRHWESWHKTMMQPPIAYQVKLTNLSPKKFAGAPLYHRIAVGRGVGVV
jgi:hypothetical protein